jgi:hypothetical protein
MARPVKVWALWSSRVDVGSEHELIQVFTYRADADAVKAGLIGKPRYRDMRLPWEDDEDFPDLYVRPIEVR